MNSETDLILSARRMGFLSGAVLAAGSALAAWWTEEVVLWFFTALAAWQVWDGYAFWRRQQELADRLTALEQEQRAHR